MPQHGDSSGTAAGAEPGLFEGLLVMLAGSGMESLGESPGPPGDEPRVDLRQARQIIDLLEMLQAKTRGNLTSREAGLLEQLLFDLRMRFLNKAGSS